MQTYIQQKLRLQGQEKIEDVRNLKNWGLHVLNCYTLGVLILHRTIKLGPKNRRTSSKNQFVSSKCFTVDFKIYISSLPTFQ